jgi:hypothetical protein
MKSIILSILLSNLIIHPVHLTITNVEYFSKTNKIEFTITLFTDDFELLINQKYNTVLNLFLENENKKADDVINSYISENLKFNINQKEISKKKYKLVKKQKEEITTKLTYSISSVKKIKTIEITNKLMTEIFYDQKNLLIFTVEKKQFALEFNSNIFHQKLNIKL